MSTPVHPTRPTLSASEIAQLAGVGRSTVSNWRQRNDDFPKPVSGNGNRLRFDTSDVRAWLRANGKETRTLAADHMLWNLIGTWRGKVDPEEIAGFIADIITLRYISDPASSGFDNTLHSTSLWPDMASSDLADKASAELERAMRSFETARPEHAPLFNALHLDRNWLGGEPHRQPELLMTVLDTVGQVDASRLEDAFVSFQDRLTRSGRRGYDDFATSDTLVNLLASAAESIPGPVHDPVVGSGRTLVATASRGADRSRLTGQDLSLNACVQSNQRALLAGHTQVDIRRGDVLRDERFSQGLAQVVVMDPPYGMRWSGDGNLLLDPRFPYGTPPKSHVDLAWLQLAIWHLGSEGRAFVLQPAGSAYRGGAEERIRVSMLRAGTVEAIVALPGGLASQTRIPLNLWVLAPPEETADPDRVLLIDHSGTPDIGTEVIIDALQVWRDDQKVPTTVPAEAFSVSDLVLGQANLDPRRWMATGEKAPGIDDIRTSMKSLYHAVTKVREPVRVSPDFVVASKQVPKLVTITELEKAGTLAVLRASERVREADYGTEGAPVVTGTWIRGGDDLSRRLDLGLLERDPVMTRPGDVLLQNTGGLAARVDEEGGRVLTSSSFHILRLMGNALRPAYLAAFLASTHNRNQSQGAAIQRVRLRDIKIPLLSREQQLELVESLAEMRALHDAAQAIASTSEAACQDLVDAISAGTVTLR